MNPYNQYFFILLLSLVISIHSLQIDTTLKSGRNLKKIINGYNINYDLEYARKGEAKPPVVYLPGLKCDKNVARSINLQTLCRREDITFLSADYYGCGKSEGDFVDGSLTRWATDTIKLIETTLHNAKFKPILVGHGVGAWIAFLVAMKRPEIVGGLVGLAADPDFTEELLWKNLSDDAKGKIMQNGIHEITWGQETYKISRTLIEDGKKNLLLNKGPNSLPIRCPVRLIHALNDEEVPYHFAVQLAQNVQSEDVNLQLIKSSSHSLEGEYEFRTMRYMILDIMAAFTGVYDLTSPGSG